MAARWFEIVLHGEVIGTVQAQGSDGALERFYREHPEAREDEAMEGLRAREQPERSSEYLCRIAGGMLEALAPDDDGCAAAHTAAQGAWTAEDWGGVRAALEDEGVAEGHHPTETRWRRELRAAVRRVLTRAANLRREDELALAGLSTEIGDDVSLEILTLEALRCWAERSPEDAGRSDKELWARVSPEDPPSSAGRAADAGRAHAEQEIREAGQATSGFGSAEEAAGDAVEEGAGDCAGESVPAWVASERGRSEWIAGYDAGYRSVGREWYRDLVDESVEEAAQTWAQEFPGEVYDPAETDWESEALPEEVLRLRDDDFAQEMRRRFADALRTRTQELA